jgi:nitroreductase
VPSGQENFTRAGDSVELRRFITQFSDHDYAFVFFNYFIFFRIGIFLACYLQSNGPVKTNLVVVGRESGRAPPVANYPGAPNTLEEKKLPSAQKTDNHFEAVTPSQHEGYPRSSKVAQQKLTDEETYQLLSLTALSLSAFNVNNCRFVVVNDPDLRKQINKFSLSQAQIPHISSLIILCADLKHQEKRGGDGGNGSQERQKATSSSKKDSRQNSDQILRDEAMCSCGIAAQTLMLTAKAMGYDSWRMDGFDYEGLGKLINLPQDYVVAVLLVVGKNIKQLWHNNSQLNFNDLVIMDQF